MSWQLIFDSLQDANMVWVLLGTLLLGISASVVGSFAVLRRRELIGDVLAHASLPGIMTAFILFETRQPGLVFTGALLSSLAGYYLIGAIIRQSKVKPDSAMAIVLSSFFGLGLIALAYIQGMDSDQKSGLDRLLFGQAAAMTQNEVNWLLWASVICLSIIFVIFQKLRLISFNRQFAKTLGIRVDLYELIFALLLVTIVVVGLQIVGVVLMAAVILIPVTIAKLLSNSLTKILWIAAGAGAISAVSSSYISFIFPNMPTGPWMVVVLGILFVLAWLFSLIAQRSANV